MDTPAEGRARTQKVVRTWNSACAAEITVAVLGGAWKPTILLELDRRGVLRFNELSRALPNPTPRVLARQLRELEQDGLIAREVFPEVPPRVEYRLTDAGRGAQQVLTTMTDWGREYSNRLGGRTVTEAPGEQAADGAPPNRVSADGDPPAET